MNRRDFLNTAVLSLLASGASLSSAANWVAPGKQSEQPDFIFYDDRFEQALSMSERLGPERPLPVQSDITTTWIETIRPAARSGPLQLAGVTTESFLFCLRTLLQENGDIKLTSERVSGDLYAWSIHAQPKNIIGVTLS